MPSRRINRQSKKCQIVNSEKIVRFQYKKKMYTYRYESSPSHGFGYLLTDGKKIYGPYAHEVTQEGREVFEAFWTEYLKTQTVIENHFQEPNLRKEVIMGP